MTAFPQKEQQAPARPRHFLMLRTPAEFRSVYQNGQRYHSPYFTAFVQPAAEPGVRLGVTATRKIGKAVLRNRCKRRIKAVFQQNDFAALLQGSGADVSGCRIVFNVKTELANADFAVLTEAIERTLQRFRSFLERRAKDDNAAVESTQPRRLAASEDPLPSLES